METINKKKLSKHDNFLKKNVFFLKTKWPHFDILFKDIKKLSLSLPKSKSVLLLERGGLYGSISLLAPYFFKNHTYSIDCSGSKIKKRGAYNKGLVKGNDIIKISNDVTRNYLNLKVKKNSFDLIIIPNLIHHVSEHEELFKQCYKILKKNGRIYIFEPILRELHQKPEDFLRFTPYGLQNELKKTKFKNFLIKDSGGPFSSIAYCWDQALQYFPSLSRKKMTKWFYKNEFPKLMKYEKKYKLNLVRKHSSFPVSFSILAQK